MKLVVRDKVDMGWRPRLKGNGRYYVLSIFLFPVTITLVLALGVWLGITTMSNFALPPFVSAMAPLAITYFIFAFFEEVGWRGYLAPKVYGLNDSLWGHALVGIIWASWHLPYMQDTMGAYIRKHDHTATAFRIGRDGICRGLWRNSSTHAFPLAGCTHALDG